LNKIIKKFNIDNNFEELIFNIEEELKKKKLDKKLSKEIKYLKKKSTIKYLNNFSAYVNSFGIKLKLNKTKKK
jgi:hypothetical protein